MTTTTPESAPLNASLAQAAHVPTNRRKLLVFAGGAVLAVTSIGWYVEHRGLEATDDAQTDGEIVAVPARLNGTIAEVAFVENQHVKAGDLLALIDDATARAKLGEAEAALLAAKASADAADAEVELSKTNALGNKSVAEAGLQAAAAGMASSKSQVDEAEAQVRSATATLTLAATDRDNVRALFVSDAVSKAELDKAETAYSLAGASLEAARSRLSSIRESTHEARGRVAEASARAKQSSDIEVFVKQARAKAEAAHAQVETAKATRDLAALDLEHTRIVAPHDGVVSKKTINEGQSVSAGQTVVQIVTPEVWVTANFKETQIGHMHPGQPVHFSADAYPGVDLSGEVESLSGATGVRFSLLPPDNATGNFTKVVQRVPVRVRVHAVPDGVVLRPGMSVELMVDTR
jgi:membrane fusion protein (multidrug efflux system)